MTPAAAAEAQAQDAVRLWLRLLSCANLIEGRVRGGLRRRFDTTLARFDVLAQLHGAANRGEDITLGELSRRMMVTNGNLTGLVARLAREGLVARTRRPDDKRSAIVKLTPAGKRRLEKMAGEHRAWIDGMFAGLTAAERARMHALVGKLKASVLAAPLENDA